jgi:DNA replication protein DnaC
MDFNFDEIIKRMSESADDDQHDQKTSPIPYPALPERHKRFNPSQSTSQDWTRLYGALNAKIYNGITIALVGQRGSGKSQMGVCLAKACCDGGRESEYKKAFEVFLRIRSAMRTEGDSEMLAVSEFLKPYLFVIDAFEVRGDTPFENRIMDHIIDKRYDALKSTIIISNDTKDNLIKTLGESVCDRMRESGGIVEMNWKSFRCSR